MRGCPISMLLVGLGYRGIHPESLWIRCGSGISPYSKRMRGRKREGQGGTRDEEGLDEKEKGRKEEEGKERKGDSHETSSSSLRGTS